MTGERKSLIKRIVARLKKLFKRQETKRGVFTLKQSGFTPSKIYLSYTDKELKALESLCKKSRIELGKI